MTDKARGTLFISYSHTARAQMLLLRKHLEGLLTAKGKSGPTKPFRGETGGKRAFAGSSRTPMPPSSW